jgi:hypothetical protein
VPSGYEFAPEYDDETQKKWELLRKPAIPESSFEDLKYATTPERCLAQMFRKSGLQIIVKMASIELTPEKPEFPIGGWHVSLAVFPPFRGSRINTVTTRSKDR